MEVLQRTVSPHLPPLPSSSSSLKLQPLLIDKELWVMAEERAQEILCTIQPNVVSDHNRKEIIDYVQRLLGGYCGAEVFPFGSVPLKTYLPDGDIDLTAISHNNVEEELAQAVCSILESKVDSEFQVKDIHYIRAQVQVVKCTVKNIAVDISFNQVAGLCSLHFLQQVDRLVGKNHLFKRSIILVKAWCYYESRILGAHHGLLSTYAVEILVLYIVNLFHSSVRGPLEVLYRFLDYYGSFDWDCYCVSINGPVSISSLPEIVEAPDCEGDQLLLSKEFLRNCMDMLSVPTSDTAAEFPIKHLNIMDPLKSNNNLGRSVSRGNFHRIKFAISFGARKLKKILTLPGESMGVALEKFFMNTLDRNGKGQRPDVQVPVPAFGTGRSEEPVLSGNDSYCGDPQHGQFPQNCSIPLAAHPISPPSPPQTDVYAQSIQQNWNVFYQLVTDAYVPLQTFYLPNASQQSELTCSFDEKRSRGTGTYIPDLAHISYSDMHMKATKPKRHTFINQNKLLESPRKKELPRNKELPQKKELVEIHSEIDMNDNLRSFEICDEEFPLLPCINKSNQSQAQESDPQNKTILQAHNLNQDVHLKVTNPRKPTLVNCKELLKSPQKKELVKICAEMNGNLCSFEMSEEEFPHLPSVKKSNPSQVQNSASSGLKISFGTYNPSEDFGVSKIPVKRRE